MAAITENDVANMALALLVEASIDDLAENTKPARLLNVHFDTVREAELSAHLWSFAAFFPDEIEAVDSESDDEFRYLYAVPSDFLRPAWLTRDGTRDGVPITFSTWADGIRSDFAGPLSMPYIANVIDPSDWSALFTDVMAAALAIKVAHPLTAKASMIEIATNAYDRAISRAARVNAFLKQNRTFEASWSVQRGDLRHWRS